MASPTVRTVRTVVTRDPGNASNSAGRPGRRCPRRRGTTRRRTGRGVAEPERARAAPCTCAKDGVGAATARLAGAEDDGCGGAGSEPLAHPQQAGADGGRQGQRADQQTATVARLDVEEFVVARPPPARRRRTRSCARPVRHCARRAQTAIDRPRRTRRCRCGAGRRAGRRWRPAVRGLARLGQCRRRRGDAEDPAAATRRRRRRRGGGCRRGSRRPARRR